MEGCNPIRIEENHFESWNLFLGALKSAHICLTDREDELVWVHAPHGLYTPKMSYIQLNIDLQLRETQWWWKGVWKLKCPIKSSHIHVVVS